ncbi:MAG: acyltransferase family protein [Arenibacterium sp.]
MKLSDVSTGRDNNFNLIRMIAAFAVLVSHAHPIALGPGAAEPLAAMTGHTLGGLAVAAFFVTSGFLITMSFQRSKSRTDFLVARFLRLWPALIVSILFVALIIGPWVSAPGAAWYFAQSETYTFILRNITLLKVQFTLPGVFEELPYTAIEGSIWTLLYEVLCYIGVFLLGCFGLLGNRWAMAGLFALYGATWLGVHGFDLALNSRLMNMLNLSLYFAVGMAFFIWRDRIVLSFWVLLGLSLLTWLCANTLIYDILLSVALAYGVFWAAYVPAGVLRLYNRVGDYSYGIYIYAFPLQGLAVWLFGPMTPIENILIATPLTLVPSVLSWHLIERPALGWRSGITGWLSRARSAEANV